MCTVSNFGLYLVFAIAMGDTNPGPCSEQYQVLEQVVAVYELNKYPTPEQKAEQEQLAKLLSELAVPVLESTEEVQGGR